MKGTESEIALAASESTEDSAAVDTQQLEIAEDTPADETDEILFLDTGDAANDEKAETADVFDMADFIDDPEKSKNGVWLDYRGKTKVRIARSGNERAQQMLARLYTANQDVIDAGGEKADALTKQIYLEVSAKCIVLGWENMNFAGMDLVYTPKTAAWLMKKSEAFKSWADTQSKRFDHFCKRASESDIETLKKLQNGD